jgi:SP family sugar:H+ symporter-like MFS transporter
MMGERSSGDPSQGAAVLLAAAAAMGGFLYGYDSAVINGAVKAIGDQAYSIGRTISSRVRRTGAPLSIASIGLGAYISL